MLDYSDFTVVKNNEGIPTALGIPIQSMLLKNNTPLFITGGGKGNRSKNNKNKVKSTSKKDKKNNDINDAEYFIEDGEAYDDIHEHLAVPVGLACMTQTVCRKTNEIGNDQYQYGEMVNNNNYDNMHIGRMNRAAELNEADETSVIPDDLYERLLKMAEETTKPKKLSRRNKKQTSEKRGKSRKNKTHKKK